jgi:hypothetical protein
MPGIPENITIAGRTPATIKGNLPPLIDTAPAARGGFRAGDDTGGGDPVGVIFSENFDDQPDWTSTSESTDNTQTVDTGHKLPINWYGIYQTTQWSPELGYPQKHASMEILASNADKSRSGTGKSAVFWRESYSFGGNTYQWASDAQCIYKLPVDVPELYVEFYIKFSPNFWERLNDHTDPDWTWDGWMSKFFRVGWWDRISKPWNAAEGGVNPRMFWGYKLDTYGVRNTVSAFQGPSSGSTTVPAFGSGSFNYTSSTKGQEVGGNDPQHQDQINGGNLADFASVTTHEQVFGPTEKWTKMAFYVKMNSAADVEDGVFSQWLDGHRIMHKESFAWHTSGTDKTATGWSFVAIGGNDFFRPRPDSERYEDWWALDDLVVRDSIPQELV